MSANITWVIDWMKASTQTINGFPEVVLSCGWNCIGEESVVASTIDSPNGQLPIYKTYTANSLGTCDFPQPQEGGSFTPYADLTQEQVLGWVWASGVDKDATEAKVAADIQLQITPAEIQPPLPWA